MMRYLMNDAIDKFFNAPAPPMPPHALHMRTDISETDTGYALKTNLPGFKKEDICIELKDGYLEISAETKKENEEKDENEKIIRKERFAGACKRRFYIGNDIQEDEIKASFEDGVLKILIPKKAEEEPEKKLIAIS